MFDKFKSREKETDVLVIIFYLGEQLLVSPSGYGVCGCIQNPVHVTMSGTEDNKCHPLYHQGPCQPGFIVQMSRTRGEAVCGPSLCGDGRVKWEDGECYTLGDQGPCEDGEYLSVSSSSLEPQCFKKKVRVNYDDTYFYCQYSMRSKECMTCYPRTLV